MFDYKKIMSMTPGQIKVVSELAKLAKKAQVYERLIRKTYLFTMGENEKEIWSNANNTQNEFLTFGGTWKWHSCINVVEDYRVDFSTQSLYERLMAREIRRSNVFQTLDEEYRKTIEQHDRECARMSRFLNEIQKLYPDEFKNC